MSAMVCDREYAVHVQVCDSVGRRLRQGRRPGISDNDATQRAYYSAKIALNLCFAGIVANIFLAAPARFRACHMTQLNWRCGHSRRMWLKCFLSCTKLCQIVTMHWTLSAVGARPRASVP